LWGLFDELKFEGEEVTDLGSGVGLLVAAYRARPRQSAGTFFQMRLAAVVTRSDGLVDRLISYTDLDEARAAAEGLAEERG
jgi:hypothetical protein